MKIITVAVQKGGTGKTTTAAALAQFMECQGESVLAVDLDPQGNLSYIMGANGSVKNSYDLLMGESIENTIQTVGGIDIIPAGRSLSTITSERGSARRLEKALAPVKDKYRLIVIDTPPTAGELQYNALQVATSVIIPLQADIYGLQALYLITDTIKAMQNSNTGLKIDGVIITRYDQRSTLVRTVRDKIIQETARQGIDYLGEIRSGVSIQEAAALQVNMFKYAAKSNPVIDYREIIESILNQ